MNRRVVLFLDPEDAGALWVIAKNAVDVMPDGRYHVIAARRALDALAQAISEQGEEGVFL